MIAHSLIWSLVTIFILGGMFLTIDRCTTRETDLRRECVSKGGSVIAYGDRHHCLYPKG